MLRKRVIQAVPSVGKKTKDKNLIFLFKTPTKMESCCSTLIAKDHLGDWSPEKDSSHPDDLFQSRYVTPGFKTFPHLFYTVNILT